MSVEQFFWLNAMKDDPRLLRAMAYSLKNPMVVELTPERKAHLSDYLVSLAEKIEGLQT